MGIKITIVSVVSFGVMSFKKKQSKKKKLKT